MQIKSLFKYFLKNSSFAYRLTAGLYPYLTLVIAALKGRRGWQDHAKSTVSMLLGDVVIKGRPMNITIEPTNKCNLECPVCETGAGTLGRPDGHMSIRQFKKILDKVGDHTNTLLFYYMGEPFINKESYEMIRYAKDIGVPFINTCTNGDAVNPAKLIESGLDEVSFQIGGMTQATHEVYRINSNIERVLKNLKETIRLKHLHQSKIQILCGFIVMKHNEHEVELFTKTMTELGVDGYSIIDPCVRDMEQGEKFLTIDKKYWSYDEESYKKGILLPKVKTNNKCSWLYYSVVIQVNGDVVPCCRDPKGEFVMGNLLNQDLEEVWNGKPFVEFREQLHKDQSKISICKLCSSYPMSQVK